MELENIKDNLLKRFTILDKYILRQVIEIVLLGIVIFSSIIFASEAFTQLIKQIADYGVRPIIAFMIILLNLPAVVVQSIPMSMLLATVMGLNKLSLSSEITVMRACGIGIDRIAKPVFIFAAIMVVFGFLVNEFIVPLTGSQSKTLAVWAVGQKNIPDGKKNYTLKETKDRFYIKRFFYVENCTKKSLDNISVIDFTNDDKTQIIQASKGETAKDGWVFKNASIYTIDQDGDLMNTSWVNRTTVNFGIEAKEELSKVNQYEYNARQLAKYIKDTQFETKRERNSYKIMLYEKFSLPVTTFMMALIGIPLAITPPRVRYNRGFLLSIFIILCFYIIRAISLVIGESGIIPPFIAVWIPNIILAVVGWILYRKKAFKIS